MILSEPELLDRIKSARRVLLIEPGYKRKYPPLALMKLATWAAWNRDSEKWDGGGQPRPLALRRRGIDERPRA